MINYANISYWFFFAVFYLIYLTYEDYKNNRKVDDRKNWFMMGLTVSLITHLETTFIYKLGLLAFIGIISVLIGKIKAFGVADNNTLRWLLLGLGMINPYTLLAYVIILGLETAVFLFTKEVIFKYKKKVAYYGVLLISFLTYIIFFTPYLFP